jgi:AraC-type DNA-binding domain-containing proteins
MNEFRNETLNTNKVALTQLQQALDGHLQEIENLNLRINIDSNLHNFIHLEENDDVYSNASIRAILEMNNDFNVFTLSNSFVKGFYIFFNNKDAVWYSNTIYNKRSFFDYILSDGKLEYENWIDFMKEKHNNEYIPTHLKSGGDKISTISCVQSIPIGDPEVTANLVVLLDESKINSAVKNANVFKSGLVYIIDENNNTLFLNSNQFNAPPDIKYQNMKDDVGIINSNYESKKVVVSYISSGVTNWKYVCVTLSSVFEQKVVYIRNLIIAGILLCILIGGIAVYVFAKKNYNPLKQIVVNLERMINIVGVQDFKDINEYYFIEKSFNSVYNEKEVISERLNKQNVALRANLIQRLMNGRFENDSSDHESLESYNIQFDTDKFFVLLIYIEDSSKLFTDNSESESGEKYSFAQYYAGQEILNGLGNNYNVYITEYNEMLACLVNLKEESGTGQQQDISMLLSEIQKVIKEKHFLDCSISVSSVVETIQAIHEAFQEAMDAMEYRFVEGNRHIILYDDIIKLRQQNYNYSYTIETEQKIINSIRIGDFEKTKALLDNVFDDVTANYLEIKVAKCLMFDIIGTFIKALNSEGILNKSQFVTELSPIKRLLECNNMNEIKSEMTSCLQEICVYVKGQKDQQSSNRIVDDINTFIQNKYSDENLSITMVADSLNMNPKYISSVYRENTGESIVDFINKTRICEAKKLLRESGMSISDTAVKVGYNNSNALIRSFKKYEGITPGQYKGIE